MKKSIVLLLPLALAAASCGTTAQYSQQRFQDGIYSSSAPQKPTSDILSEDDFRLLAARSIAEKEAQRQDSTLKNITVQEVYVTPGSYEWDMYFSPFPLIAVGIGYNLAWSNWYWHRWHTWWDPWYSPWYGPSWHHHWYGPSWYDPWYGPVWHHHRSPEWREPGYVGPVRNGRGYQGPRNTTTPGGRAYGGGGSGFGGRPSGGASSRSAGGAGSSYRPGTSSRLGVSGTPGGSSRSGVTRSTGGASRTPGGSVGGSKSSGGSSHSSSSSSRSSYSGSSRSSSSSGSSYSGSSRGGGFSGGGGGGSHSGGGSSRGGGGGGRR